MVVEVKGTKLVITLDIDDTNPVSPSGKTKKVASSNGNITTAVQYKGKPLVVGVNAYISNK
jgi:hypothetical protein